MSAPLGIPWYVWLAYGVAVSALCVAIWKQAGDADRSQAALKSRQRDWHP